MFKTTPDSSNKPYKHGKQAGVHMSRRCRINLWNQHRHRPSNLRPGSLYSSHLRYFAFNLYNLFKTAVQTRKRSLLLGGAAQLFPGQMSLMKMWPWPPVTFFLGWLSQKPSAFTNSLHVHLMIHFQAVHGVPVLGCTPYLVVYLRRTLAMNF